MSSNFLLYLALGAFCWHIYRKREDSRRRETLKTELAELVSRSKEFENLKKNKIELLPESWKTVYKTFIAVDLETTGLSKATSRIVEIALVKYVNGTKAATYHSYVYPGIKIPSSATKVNNITDDMIRHSPMLYQIKDEIISFIGRFPLVGHNLDYDINILSNDISRYNNFMNPILIWGYCTMRKSFEPPQPKSYTRRGWQSYQKWLKLKDAMALAGVEPVGEFHSAYTDATGAGDLFVTMARNEAEYRKSKIDEYFIKLESTYKELLEISKKNDKTCTLYLSKAQEIIENDLFPKFLPIGSRVFGIMNAS